MDEIGVRSRQLSRVRESSNRGGGWESALELILTPLQISSRPDSMDKIDIAVPECRKGLVREMAP